MNDQTSPKRRGPWRICRIFLALLTTVVFVAGLAFYWHSQRKTLRWHFRVGVEAFEENDLDRVRVAAEVFEGVDGYEPQRHLLEGMVLLRSGRLFEAIETFGEAKDHPDTQALAYALSGEALYRAGVFRDAERILAAAIRLDPSQTDARRWLAALYYDVGAMERALEQLSLVAEAAPEDPRAHRLIGLIHRDFERYGEATHSYRESLRRDPDQPDKDEILVELGECLVRQRLHAEALETLDRCRPSAKALVLKADCRYGQGGAEAARRLVDEALALEPSRLEALDLKATLELDANQAESALATLLLAVDHHPKDYQLRYRLARLYQRLGKEEPAREQLKLMKELRALRDRFTELHEEAMKDPADAEIRYQLGVVAGQLDKTDLARNWFKMTLALDPDHAEAREALRALSAPTAPTPQEPASPSTDSAGLSTENL